MSKTERNNEILYYILVRNKPQADVARMFGNMTRQRVNEIKQTYLKRFLDSQLPTLLITAPNGHQYALTKQHIQQYL